MKNKYLLLSSALLILSYQNCGQTFFDTPRSQDFSSVEGTSYSEEYKLSNPVALLSSEQILKSMASVTGVPLSNGAVNNEYNQRSGLFAANYELKNVNSPMLMGIANLASVFCNQALTTEAALADGNRKFFNGVNFNVGASSYSDAAFQRSMSTLGLAFWGREITSKELGILTQGKADFLSEYTTAELANSASTRNLALYSCTAMLASPDSYTF